jgi:subtilisin family serine protease
MKKRGCLLIFIVILMIVLIINISAIEDFDDRGIIKKQSTEKGKIVKGYIIQFVKPAVLENEEVRKLNKEIREIKKEIILEHAEDLKSSLENKEKERKNFVLNYEKELKKEHENALKDIQQKLGKELANQNFLNGLKNFFMGIFGVTGLVVKEDKLILKGEFYNVFNGISLEINKEEAEKLKKSKYVKDAYPNLEVHTTLMDSIPLINADDVWQLDVDGNDCSVSGKPCLTGQGISIAIIDTGVDYNHIDLGGCFGINCKVTGGWDFVNNDGDPMDDHGHGTHCAGIAAGKGALKGSAPDAKLYAYKVLDSRGSGSMGNVIAAIEQSFLDGADIISLSLGGLGNPDDPTSQSVDNIVNAGVVVVVSAGNSGPEGDSDCRNEFSSSSNSICSPGTARKSLTVGATDKSDSLAGFSSRGPVIWGEGMTLSKPDLTAPGVNICSAQWDSAWNYAKCFDENHVAISGTSMAAPHVAGAAALLKQKNPLWIPEEIKKVLKDSTINLPYTENEVGKGRLDILSAIISDPPTIAELDSYGESIGVIDIKGSAFGQSFESYTLSYGEGVNPGSWIDLITSNSQVKKDILYSALDTTFLKEDQIYTLNLIVQTSAGATQDIDYIIPNNVYISNPQNNELFDSGHGTINIEGTAKGTNFQNYEIKIKFGDDWFTTGITLANGGNNEIVDNILGWLNINEIINNFGNGVYTLKLIVHHNDGSIKEDSVRIYIEDYQDGWPIRIPDTYVTDSVVVGDIDKNGDLEVLIGGGSTYEISAWNHDGTLMANWPILFNGASGSLSLADFDNDRKNDLEVVISSSSSTRNSKIYIYQHDGRKVLSGWPQELIDKKAQISTIGDIDNDGDLEIIVPTLNYAYSQYSYIYAFHHDGTLVNGWPLSLEYPTGGI